MPLERGKPPSRLDAPIQSLPPAQFLHLPEREFQRHRPSSRTKLPIERLAGDDDGIVAPDQSKTPNNGQATPATSGGRLAPDRERLPGALRRNNGGAMRLHMRSGAE
jgi:hypothetical protein